MNYLLDTCVISDFFKKIPSVIHHLEKLSPKQVYVSSITVMEIEYGLKLHIEREIKIRPQWHLLLEYIQVIPFSQQCGVAAALIRSQLKNEGLPIGPYDILIAGTALANNMTLVSSNLREFQRVSNIVLEDWRSKEIAHI